MALKDYTSNTSPTLLDELVGTRDSDDKTMNFPLEDIKELIETGTITELNKSRGFDRLAPATMGVPAYDEATRTFSLAVKSGETYFQFWADGIRFEKTTTQSIVWANTSGAQYFYFNTSGVLQSVMASAMTYEIFVSSAICGMVGFNATTGKTIVEAVDEQHGIGMPATTHFRLHLRDGAVNLMGGNITGLAHGSDEYTSIAQAVSADEDINIVTALTTATPFLYRIGAGNEFVETTPDMKVGFLYGGNLQFNKNTGGVWSLEDSAKYVIYYFYWTNDANNPIKKLVGNEEYDSRDNARDALDVEVGIIQETGLPSPEAYPMFAYIVRDNGDLEDSGGAGDYTYVDLRHKHYFDAKD